MRRETVAQGMRGQAVGQSQPSTGRGNRPAHKIRVERPSPSADKEWRIPRHWIRALTDIIVDRLPHGRNDWYDACLRSLAGDPQGRPNRQVARDERERLG